MALRIRWIKTRNHFVSHEEQRLSQLDKFSVFLPRKSTFIQRCIEYFVILVIELCPLHALNGFARSFCQDETYDPP